MTAPKQIKNERDEASQSLVLRKRDAKGRFIAKLELKNKIETVDIKNAAKDKAFLINADAGLLKTKKTNKSLSKTSCSKKDAAAEVKAILKAATPEAARLLIEIMLDEERPLGTRLDCANKIIERVCGKAGQNSNTAGNEVFKIVLSDEVKKYAK